MPEELAAGRVPLGNMYEYSLLLSFLVVLAYLVFVEGIAKVADLGGFVLGFAVLTMAVAVLFLYVGPAPLNPALNSYWRQIHVSSMIVSSSLLALGGMLTILYLVKERRERSDPSTVPPIMGGDPSDLEDAPPHFEAGGDEPAVSAEPARARAPALGPDPRPPRVPDDRVRLPDLDLRHHHRGDLGRERMGPLLGMGPEGDLVVRRPGWSSPATSMPGPPRAGRAAEPR